MINAAHVRHNVLLFAMDGDGYLLLTQRKNFAWTDEQVELLLRATLDYKKTKPQIGIDWESCHTKYQDIMV